jgi:tetratricopeptide (TPR) repeat protein
LDGAALPARYELARQLYAAGDLAEAYTMVAELVSIDRDPVWSSRGRALLASIADDFEWYETALHHLGILIAANTEADQTSEARRMYLRIASRRDELELDVLLPLLQTRYCFERLTDDPDDADTLRRLAQVVRELGSGPDQIVALERAAGILRAAVGRQPGSLELARGLLHCDQRLEEERTVDESLARLDDLEPESSELESIATRLAGREPPRPGGFAVWGLWAIIDGERDPGLTRAALADLIRRAARPPHDEVCTMVLAVALSACGETEALAHVLKALVNLPPRDQTFHYNLCQLLAEVGEIDAANRHLELAARRSTTQQELDEVGELRERCGWARRPTDG